MLKNIIDNFDVIASNTVENTTCTNPRDMVIELATQKACAVASQHYDSVVIGADTIVVLDGTVLGKPKTAEQAYDMLMSLSGRDHLVYTGVCICNKGKSQTFYDVSTVSFTRLLPIGVKEYIATGSPYDKAGGYGVQDCGFISNIEGSYYNVMGLPVEKLTDYIAKYL